jgi:regulator of protease activity HflC (stomatin/prohibitin superfamily)
MVAQNSPRLTVECMTFTLPAILLVLAIVIALLSAVTVKQSTVAVVTMFGKYRRVMSPGLNFRIPLIEQIARRVSVQNQAAELQFQATTRDQAQVNFTTMVLYTVQDSNEETIQRVAFKFITPEDFYTALVRTIESAIRSLVATKAQAEILGLRTEIVSHVKEELDSQLADWGYHLLDLQVNDISFGAAIMTSMERVVAAQNERVAAENEGAALLIRETKKAEAQGAAIQIAAKAEMEASRLRGQGVAAFRQEVAGGMADAADRMEASRLDPSYILFSMWTETMRNIASEGRGNLITFDGSVKGMEGTLQQLMAMQRYGSTDTSSEDSSDSAAASTTDGTTTVSRQTPASDMRNWAPPTGK